MEREGSIFRTTTDSEVVLHLIARSRRKTVPEMIADALGRVKGAFSMVFLTPDMLIGVKDPHSFRPLVLGKKGSAWVLASETCAFDIIKAEFVRCVKPGEMVVIHRGGRMESFFPWGETPPGGGAACIFEFIYFSRPDSVVFGAPVEKIRRQLGIQLAREHPADADIVIAVPDSSNTAALGYAQESGIPFELGLIRNHYIGRTFIQPTQEIREFGARLKYNPVRWILEGKRVVVVDDSIVRGTTSRQLVRLIREAGAKEVHFRVASPKIVAPCFYGIDTPTSEELIAANMTVDEIRDFIGADSLGYLSLEGLLSIEGLPNVGYCTACFGTDYPVPPEDDFDKTKMER
ncbi:MAG TPA: amidophosphoribosyltransferase, partial [candidate division Zixibacteria bacterium]|nr:amidophosphoribosyltransferase [candidate division Zixibacteria bacterium]